MTEAPDIWMYVQLILALAFVIGLILLFAWAGRRFGLMGAVPRRTGQRRRLFVVEVLPLSTKHRIVLVRRDETEHLLLLGAQNDCVIESGIDAGFRTRLDDALDDTAEPTSAESRPALPGKDRAQ